MDRISGFWPQVMQFRGFQWCSIFQQTQVLDGCVFFGNFGVNHIYRRLQDWILMDNCHLHELNMWSAMDLGVNKCEQHERSNGV